MQRLMPCIQKALVTGKEGKGSKIFIPVFLMRLQNLGKIETGTSITFPVVSNDVLQHLVNIHLLGKGFLFPNVSPLCCSLKKKNISFLINNNTAL